MSAIEGFLTGFANVAASNILERKKEARDYFNKQVEYARTTGLENRRRVREQADVALTIARQLEAAGVPKDLIMAQINMNPTGLADFYEQAEKIRASYEEKGKTPDWNAIKTVMGEFKPPEVDMATYISQTFDPIANAADDPTYEDDPQGSLFATMMGYNAMDRARADLGRTEIAEGLTAEQLIRYGDVTPQRVGGRATVITNYAAASPEGSDGLSITDSDRVATLVETVAGNATLRLMQDWNERTGTALDPKTLGADQVAVLREAIAAEILQMPLEGINSSNVLPYVDNFLESRGYDVGRDSTPLVDRLMGTGGSETGVEPPPSGLPTEGSPEAPPPSSPPPSASTEVSGEPLSPEERLAAQTGLGYESIKDNGNGTITVVFNGQTRTYRTSDVRELLNRFMTQ